MSIIGQNIRLIVQKLFSLTYACYFRKRLDYKYRMRRGEFQLEAVQSPDRCIRSEQDPGTAEIKREGKQLKACSESVAWKAALVVDFMLADQEVPTDSFCVQAGGAGGTYLQAWQK